MEEFDYKKEIEEILKNSRDEIKKEVKEQIKEKIVDRLSWTLNDEIDVAIKDTVKTELEDEIKKVVVECKEEILNGIKPAFCNIGVEIAKGLEKQAIENLKNSWKSEEIFKKLFD